MKKYEGWTESNKVREVGISLIRDDVTKGPFLTHFRI